MSRNDNIYLPEELQAGDGLVIPFYDEHEDFERDASGQPTGKLLQLHPRGRIKLAWDNILKQLKYAGEVWDKDLIQKIRSGARKFVSLAAAPKDTDNYRGHNVPLGLRFFSASAVSDPGIPETTLNMAEGKERPLIGLTVPIIESLVKNFRFLVMEGKIDSPDGSPGESGALGDPQDQPEIISASATVSEPLHPDYQKTLSGMKSKYGDEKGTSVFYAWRNKHGLDDTKPMPKSLPSEALLDALEWNGGGTADPNKAEPDTFNHLDGGPQDGATFHELPKAPQAMTPAVNAQPGPIVTKMPYYGKQGTSPSASLEPQEPTLIRPLMHSAESLDANKAASVLGEAVMAPKPSVKEGEGDAATAQDKTVNQAASVVDADVKPIGLPKTPYEGAATPVSLQEEDPEIAGAKTGQAGPPGKPAADMGAMGEEEEQENAGDRAGFTKEQWSVMSKSERRAANVAFERANKVANEIVKRALEEAGLAKPGTSISQRRESRAGGPDIQANIQGFGFEMVRTPELDEVLRIIRGESKYGSGVARVPILSVPRAADERAKLKSIIESFNDRYQNIVLEAAIATTTSGAALGVDEMTPALVVPTNIAALVRDTLLFRALPQGVDRARFQTVTVPAAGALTQDTEPSQSTQTLATVDVTTAPRGVEVDISFEAERKIIGPILDAMILGNRLSELYDEDTLLLGTSQAFAGATIPTTGGIQGNGNTFYGDGTVAATTSILSTMLLAAKAFDFARAEELAQGYAPDNMVGAAFPKGVYDLFNDTNITRYLQFGPNTDMVRSMLGAGIIPSLFGIELRQSTLGKTGTGTTAGVTTYYTWVWKKGLTAAMAASRDVMIETFRDIRKNATVLKSHWDLGINVVHPNSLISIITA